MSRCCQPYESDNGLQFNQSINCLWMGLPTPRVHNKHDDQVWWESIFLSPIQRHELSPHWRLCSKVKSFPRALRPWGGADLRFISPQPDTSRSRKTTDTGLVYHVVCPFTPQLSLVLINRPRRDGTLSWRWYTAAAGGIRTRDLAIASPAPYHSATAYHCVCVV